MLLNKLTRWICGFFLIPIVTYASTKVTVDPKAPSACIGFSGREAKNLWEYLEKIKETGSEFILGDTCMGTSYLTSPSMTCSRIHGPYYNVPDKDPSLYECYINLDDKGLAK